MDRRSIIECKLDGLEEKDVILGMIDRYVVSELQSFGKFLNKKHGDVVIYNDLEEFKQNKL